MLGGFSGHECGSVVEAKRLADGTIRAKCDNGEVFRIAFMDGEPFVVNRLATEKHGIENCP